MQSPAPIILIAIAAIPVVLATIHTECFEYFRNKDGCVWAAADERIRCNPQSGKPPDLGVGAFHEPQYTRTQQPLVRRYTSDSTNTTFSIGGGNGICGHYSTHHRGACLWVGTEQVKGDNASTAGWLNGAKTSNCGKQLYVERKDNTSIVIFPPIVDGCTFYTTDIQVGCFEIALTKKSWKEMHPTPKEEAQGYLDGVIWDFNDEHGDKLANAPV